MLAREIQSRLLVRAFGDLAIDSAVMPPVALATIVVAIGRLLANEERVGITLGHDETREVVDWALQNLQPRPDRDSRNR